MSKLWISVLAILLVASNGFWLYVVIDNGITQTYMESSYRTLDKAYEQLIVLSNLELKGLTASEAVNVIGSGVDGSEPFMKDGCLYVGSVCLRLNERNIVVGISE